MSPTVFVETSDLVGAARSLDAVGERLWSALSGALADAMACTGMAGDDPAGLSWAAGYSTAASQSASAAQAVLDGVFQLGTLLTATARNYAAADAASTIGGRHALDDVLAGAPTPPTVTLATRFDDVGGGDLDRPFGWSIVERVHRLVWPNGHQDRLLRAAGAWRRSAAALDARAFDVELASLSALADDLPEGEDIHTACFALAGHLREVGAAHRSLALACEGFAYHLDVTHSEIEHQLQTFVEQSAGVEIAGGLFAYVTAGMSELAAQGLETWRIDAAVTRIVALVGELGTAVGRLAAELPGVEEVCARVSASLEDLLSIRVVTAEVAGVPGLRVLSVARDGRPLDAVGRLEVNATEIGEGGGHYVHPPTRVDVTDPTTFDPRSIEGMTRADLENSIPSNWESKPSKNGGGVVYEDPLRRGRQIRIMPGYGPGVRSDPLTEGPYAVISQNGHKPIKVALYGNGVLR